MWGWPLRRVVVFAAAMLLLQDAFAQSLSEAGFPIVFPLVAPIVSSKYGARKHPIRKVVRDHGGVDLAAPLGSHVRSVAEGTVIFEGQYGGYGKLVTIKHRYNQVSLYGHLSEVRVNIGSHVAAGEIIGRVGSSGESTGPHLHFEWRRDGKTVDPLKLFPDLAISADG